MTEVSTVKVIQCNGRELGNPCHVEILGLEIVSYFSQKTTFLELLQPCESRIKSHEDVSTNKSRVL